MIQAIIIDDELNAIKNLKWEIERFCRGVVVRDSFTNPIEAISAINYLKPDCIFLDIEMPEMDGFQLLQKLHYRDFDLIITTAYDNYAIKAFKANAVDYLLKPIDTDDLLKAVEKVKNNKEDNSLGFELRNVLDSLNSGRQEKIALPMAGKSIFVEPNDIVYCKSDGNYSTIYLFNDQSYLLTRQLKEIESLLHQNIFCRVHNSYIVNLNEVREFVRTEGSYLIMSNDIHIPISRSKKEMIQNLLNV